MRVRSKAIGAVLILAAALAAPAALLADTTPAPAAASRSSVTLAPPSPTSAAVLMARAFRPQPRTCDVYSPGTQPVLEPAPVNQPSCLLSPFSYDQWALCPTFPASPVMPLAGLKPAKRETAFVVGDQIDSVETGVSLISGNAQLDQGDRRVTSDRMTYDSNSGIVLVNQGVHYASPRMMLSSPSGVYDSTDGTGTFQDSSFLMPKRHGRGHANVFNVLDDDRSQLYNAAYSTCPLGHDDWLLTAPDLYLNTATNTGEGHDVTIDFFSIPIFWSPYLNFPINDDRKSGFIGLAFSFDVINGFEISAPYYFNLAENYDALLYPRAITKRGMQNGGQFDWLDGIDQGEIYGDYLNHDQLADRERSQFYFSDTASFNEFNSMTTLYEWVSDDEYFHDLGTDLSATSTTILPRRVQYSYDDEMDWSLMSQLEDFQTIVPGLPPQTFSYRRLPQVVAQWNNNEDLTGPEYGLYAEAVRFQRELRIGADRTDIKPSVSLPFSDAAGYFTPTLAWRLTDYDLSGNNFTAFGEPTVAVDDRHESRATPIFDIDTGLFFDRDAGNYLQTLEPRLYYLRVPYRNQDQIPIFDAVQPQFSYLQLFSDNRFYGADRQGDANQLSYALTSRFLDSLTGVQLFQVDIGQARYFADRRVQLNPGTPPDTTSYSDVAGDMLYDFNEVWTASYSQDWNPTTRQTDLASVLLEYHPGYQEVINLGYEFVRPNIKQPTISFAWPLNGAWSVVGGWNYDVMNHDTLEQIWGFEYDSCCWNFQLVHRRYLQPNRVYDNVFFFSLQLKGLTTIGRHLEQLLQRDILGYTDSQFSEPLQPEEQPTPP